MPKITLSNVATGHNSAATVNADFDEVALHLNDKVLYRDNPSGETNSMFNDIDMGSNEITNLKAPTSSNSAARLVDVQEINDITALAPSQSGNADKILQTDGTVATWSFITNDNFDAGAAIASTKLSYTAAGTGAVARQVNAKLDDLVSVKDFGATGDGSTDDTAAFVAALNTGKGLYIPYSASAYMLTTWSLYTTTAPLIIRSNGATLDIDDTTQKVFQVKHDVDVQGVTFKNADSVLYSPNTETAVVDSIRVTSNTFDTCRSPVFISGPYNTTFLQSNLFKACKNHVVHMGDNTFSKQDTWKNTIVSNNVFRDTVAETGQDLRCTIAYGRQFTFTGNVIDGATGVSTNETHGVYHKARWALITNNTFRGIATGTTQSAISLKGHTRAATAQPQGYSTVAANNIIHGNNSTTTGIRVITDDCLVTDNIIDDVALIGIECSPGGLTPNRISIDSNHIFDGGNATLVLVNAVGSDYRITNNTLYGGSVGLKVEGGGGDGVIITSNKFHDGAITFNMTSELDNVTIQTNHFTGGTTRMLRMDGTAINGMSIIDNINNANNSVQTMNWDTASSPKGLRIRHTFDLTTSTGTATAVNYFAVRDDSAGSMRIDVVGRETAGTNARGAYRKHALFYSTSGTVALEGTVQTTSPDIESVAGLNATMAVSSPSVSPTVTGITGNNVKWKVAMEYDQVDY